MEDAIPTHPIEGARYRDAWATESKVLDEVVHTDMFVLHVRFGPNIRKTP